MLNKCKTFTGEPGTGDVIEAVRHARSVRAEIRKAAMMDDSELYAMAKEISAPYELLKQVAKAGRLPVVMFSYVSHFTAVLCLSTELTLSIKINKSKNSAGGIATPADAAVSLFNSINLPLSVISLSAPISFPKTPNTQFPPILFFLFFYFLEYM